MAELKGDSSQASLEPEKPESKSKSFRDFLQGLKARWGRPKSQPADLTPKPEPPPKLPEPLGSSGPSRPLTEQPRPPELPPEQNPPEETALPINESKRKDRVDLQPIPPEEPEITKFRRALGLPKEPPVEMSPEAKRLKREQKLSQVLAETKTELKVDQEKRDQSQLVYRQQEAERREQYLINLPFKDKIARLGVITLTAIKGYKSLKEAATFISDLENDGSFLLWRIQKRGKVDWYPCYSNLSSYLDKKQFVQLIREVPDLSRALKRLDQLIRPENKQYSPRDFDRDFELIAPLLPQMATLDEKKFQLFIDQLKQYPILQTVSSHHEHPPQRNLFKDVVQAMANGGFSDEQWAIFNEVQAVIDLIDDPSKLYEDDLSGFKAKREETKARLTVIGEIIRAFPDYKSAPTELTDSNHLFDFLDKTKQLPALASLIEQGIQFDREDIYSIFWYGDSNRKTIPQLNEIVNQIITDGQLPYLQAFQEYLGIPDFVYSRDLAYLLPLARTLAAIDRFPKFEIDDYFNNHFNFYRRNLDKESKIRFVYGQICRPRTDVHALLPKEEQSFWNFLSKQSDFEMQKFLCCHRQDFPVLVKNNLATPELIITAATEGVPPSGYGSLLTDEIITLLPKVEQPYWQFFKNSPDELKAYLISKFDEREKFTDYYQDNHPTLAFLEKMALDLAFNQPGKKSASLILSLLSEEIINTFPPDKQPYWRLAFTSGDFGTYLIDQFPILNQLLTNQSEADFFSKIISPQAGEVDPVLDLEIGGRVSKLPAKEVLIKAIVTHQLSQLDRDLQAGKVTGIDLANWPAVLNGFLMVNRVVEDYFIFNRLSEASSLKIKALFEDPKTKAICLDGYRQLWLSYLSAGKPEGFPLSLTVLSEMVSLCGGAGPLSQFEAIALFTKSVRDSFLKETTAERTKTEIYHGLAAMEERFNKEKWSNEDRTEFYNISRDIINAAPSLYTDFLTAFKDLSPSQLKKFSKELYPLYRTQITLLEKVDSAGHRKHDLQELVNLRNDLRLFGKTVKAQDNYFDIERDKVISEIKRLFKDRFGIIKVPEDFTSEQIRTITNISLYLSNLSGRTSEKETLLSFYLALMINDQWDEYRRGEEVKPSLYLTPEKSALIEQFLEKRKTLDPLTAQNLGLKPEEIPEFQALLQPETQSLVIGNVETVDVKLTNIILNLEGLTDEDLFPEKTDKELLRLYQEYGNKKVNSVLARTYQQLSSPTRKIEFSPEDLAIQSQVSKIVSENGLEMTPQTIKNLQDRTKPIATVINLLETVKSTGAEAEIKTLQGLLTPDIAVIEIFNRLGEDFKPSSGVMALSQDLDYLDNLLIKHNKDLTNEEKTLLEGYLKNIRGQMVKLEGILKLVIDKFRSIEQGNITNPLLKNRIEEIKRIVTLENTRQAITSTATNDLNLIIENIRACLSCKVNGGNNDTDLTFGDSNKFYIFSQSEAVKTGSISDQILFIEPVKYRDGSQGIALVFDRIYGVLSGDVLANQVEAVLKKYRMITRRFPSIKLSVVISSNAMQSVGTSADLFKQRLESSLTKGLNILEEEGIEVDVVESATGDHYIEFDGGSRSFGKRSVRGLVIKV